MNDSKKKYLWKLIQSTGDYLINKLPNHPNHPSGRNPYAHVALKVKINLDQPTKIYQMKIMMKL